jgi:hypothetical protein
MTSRTQADPPLRTCWRTSRRWWAVALASGLAAGCATWPPEVRVTRTFGGSGRTLDANGNPTPLQMIDLRSLAVVESRRLPIHGSAHVEIRSALEGIADDDFDYIADLVGRSYRHIEATLGLPMTGDTMIYLVPFDHEKYSYSYKYQCEAGEHWAFVAAAMFLPGETVKGNRPCASLHQDLLGGLPHEFTHHVLHSIENLLEDNIGEQSHHTRWFTDGLGNVVADGFARRINPAYADAVLKQEQIGTILEHPEVRERVLTWVGTSHHFLGESEAPGPPKYEREFYAAATLLVMAWSQHVSLAEMLERIRNRGRPVDGAELLAIVKETTGLDPPGLIEAARKLGQAFRERTERPQESEARSR